MQDINIRPLLKTDIPTAVTIVGKNYSQKYGEMVFQELQEMFKCDSNPPTYIVAEYEGVVVGFVGFIQSWMDYQVYSIFWMNVAPAYQRRGIGSQLLNATVEKIKDESDARLILLTTSSPDYYTRFNFNTLQYFGPQEEHALMALSLV